MSTAKACARGARSAAPTEPRAGTTGVIPAFNRSAIACATEGEMPDAPATRPASLAMRSARVVSLGKASPTPTMRARSVRRWKSARSAAASGGIHGGAERRRQAVDRVAALRRPFDRDARRRELRAQLRCELDARPSARHRHDLGNAEPVYADAANAPRFGAWRWLGAAQALRRVLTPHRLTPASFRPSGRRAVPEPRAFGARRSARSRTRIRP